MVTCCVLFAVQTELLNFVWMNFGFKGTTAAATTTKL
jgi:hypothetical protein